MKGIQQLGEKITIKVEISHGPNGSDFFFFQFEIDFTIKSEHLKLWGALKSFVTESIGKLAINFFSVLKK